MKRGIPAPNKAESDRLRVISDYGCIISRMKWRVYVPPEIHHINDGGRNISHWHTLPLSVWYHRGVCNAGMPERDMIRVYGHSLIHGSRLFERDHGTERRLWEIIQRLFGYDRSWPETKILPRRCG